MSAWGDFKLRDQRLVTLRILRESAGASNDSVLRQGLASVNHLLLRADVRSLLRWLENEGLVRLRIISPESETPESDRTLWLCELTETGEAVALGHRTHTGVARPSLRA